MSNARLKICHFSSVHYLSDTRVFYRECLSLANHYDVTLIATNSVTGDAGKIKMIPIPKPKSRISRILNTTRKVYKLALAENADIYHFHDPELIPFAWLLKRKGKKVIYDIHENVTESLKDKKWLPLKGLFTWFYLRFDALAAKHFSLILAENSYIKVYKKRYPSTHTTLVRNYASATLLKPFSNTSRKTNGQSVKIFYMGTIDEQYCCKPMLESIYLLNKQGIDASIKMIGWVAPEIRKQMDDWPFMNQIREKIMFTGPLEITRGYEYSLDCNLGYSFVSDNLNVSQSLPRKMYEYMHIGLPVISSGHELYRDLVETNALGLCVNTNTAAEIAQAVRSMLKSGDHLNQLALNNIKAAAVHFNWEAEAETMFKLYRSLEK